MADAFVACAADLVSESASVSLRAWWIPGRIEVLGKHTDYAGGRSLVCATDLGGAYVARVRQDASIRIHDLRTGLKERFDIHPELDTATGDWTNYPRTAARRLAYNFGFLKGADISFFSNLPLAAGMSSSSALIVAFSMILIELNHLRENPVYQEHIKDSESLAGYLGTVENGQTFGGLEGDAGVGTFGGSEDHTAILCAEPGLLKQYRFCPVVFEKTIAFPDDLVFVIANSGVIAEKTGAALDLYNQASALARHVAVLIGAGRGEPVPHLAAAVEQDEIAALRKLLEASSPEPFALRDVLDRFDQFVFESQTIIPAASKALDSGDVTLFGECCNRSQSTGAKLLKNQVKETEWLATRATKLGAYGASAFGAGFGGSVWALIEEERAEAFRQNWEHDYAEVYPERTDAEYFVTRPGPSAFELRLDPDQWSS